LSEARAGGFWCQIVVRLIDTGGEFERERSALLIDVGGSQLNALNEKISTAATPPCKGYPSGILLLTPGIHSKGPTDDFIPHLHFKMPSEFTFHSMWPVFRRNRMELPNL
jgi:hypothetical protein